MTDMREAFEAWWFEESTVEELERARDVEAECWLSWQAAWAARKPREGFVEVPVEADPLTQLIQRLNGTPYSLTKDECIEEAKNLRAMLAARPNGEAQ